MGRPVSGESFWSSIPLRGRAMFWGAVFCIFAPGMLLPFQFPGASWAAVAMVALVSGSIGLSWALAFTAHRGWLVPAVVLQVLSALAFGGLAPAWLWPARSAFDPLGAAGFVLVVAGYVLFIRFIATEGRRSVRERTELQLAKQIHERLVPPIEQTALGWDVVGKSVPNGEVGGDLVDVIVGERSLDVYLGDVTGHGVKSGVVMAMTKASIHTARRQGAGMTGVLERVNDIIEDLTDPGTFVTFAALTCDERGGG